MPARIGKPAGGAANPDGDNNIRTPDATMAFADLTTDYKGAKGAIFRLALATGIRTVLTAGFYRFWMKTRMRRYYWSAIRPGGMPLEYVGRPTEKLLGFLTAVVFLAFYIGIVNLILMFFSFSLFEGNTPAYAVSVVGITPLIFFAQYRARRYVLARTRWRGIRFGLEPGVAGFVWRSLLHWGLTVLTAGLYWPVKTYWLEKYRTDRTFYGEQRMHQGGSWRMLIKPMLHLYLSAALLAGTIGMLIATEDPRFAPLIFIAVPWFFFGLAAWKAGSFRALTNTKTIGEARLKASPRTGRIVGIYAGGWAAMGGIFIAAGIGVSILFGIIFAATGFALENIDEDGYLTTLGNLPAFVPILFGIITYFAIFIFWGVLKEVFITLPVAQHFAETTEIENPQALLGIKQRARDEFAEAEGFADALPLGDAF
ncbi:uncharacterized protein DUF898 [Maritimibacter alkaliphilus HTCC2654]|uniref:DUF898 domain-containing protein n=2 Tax=Maritimibacter TaxID=404235 RepID=A3VFM4_9RHOB|nr:hypothetical protein RB2654_11593 [Rhodobacterales bacterium HTCC2654] [Maritimibacter alkaliphilus HTCC2654]TYP78860.1 uncharacterized protein DUF898 [Maritimibacter alkaliphilus HTCC2654]